MKTKLFSLLGLLLLILCIYCAYLTHIQASYLLPSWFSFLGSMTFFGMAFYYSEIGTL